MSMRKISPLPEIERGYNDWCIELGLYLITIGLVNIEVREFNCFLVIVFPENDPQAYNRVKGLKDILHTPLNPGEPAKWSAQTTGLAYSLLVDVPLEFHEKNVPTVITNNV